MAYKAPALSVFRVSGCSSMRSRPQGPAARGPAPYGLQGGRREQRRWFAQNRGFCQDAELSVLKPGKSGQPGANGHHTIWAFYWWLACLGCSNNFPVTRKISIITLVKLFSRP